MSPPDPGAPPCATQVPAVMGEGVRYQALLFSERALTGEDGYGYYKQSDPSWFVWKEQAFNTSEFIIHRAVKSPLVATWHVVARSKPCGRLRYRGAHTRVKAFTPDPDTMGMLLQRAPTLDMADLHCSLQDRLEVTAHVPMPIVRAKHSMVQLMYSFHGVMGTVTNPPYPEFVNIMVFDCLDKKFMAPAFFMSLLLDEVCPDDAYSLTSVGFQADGSRQSKSAFDEAAVGLEGQLHRLVVKCVVLDLLRVHETIPQRPFQRAIACYVGHFLGYIARRDHRDFLHGAVGPR